MREEEFLEFVASVLGVGRESVSLETAYGSILEWDSVMHLRLVMEIQEKYGVDIPIERVPEVKTLREFFEFVA